MGGDRITPFCLTPEEELESSVDQELSQLDLSYHSRDDLGGTVVEDGAVNKEGEFVYEGNDEVVQRVASSSLEIEAKRRKRCNAYREVLQSYDQLCTKSKSLKEAKSKILSYTPGGWIEKAGGMNLSDYDVPNTTTLLLIGPKGSGKSSLINRISKVFDDNKFASERAQVSYNYSDGDGTYFLQEYMIPRGSTSFCLYDTRGLCDDSSDNIEMVKQWVTKGVHHGELIIRPSDCSTLRTRMKCKARQDGRKTKLTRMVNFVIFVINGLAVHKSVESGDGEGTEYMKTIATTFNCPYLSFKDDKPVVAATHGDLLSPAERARVRVYLGELLGIPPMKQIFDIPERCDPAAELSVAEMIIYSLEHADKNLPHKDWRTMKVGRVSKSACICLLMVLGIAILSICIKRARIGRHPHTSKVDVDWHTIRHLWLE